MIDIRTINDIRAGLIANNFYTDDRVGILINGIKERLDADIIFDKNDLTLKIKLKKSTMKKEKLDPHNLNLFYSLFDNIFKQMYIINRTEVQTILIKTRATCGDSEYLNVDTILNHTNMFYSIQTTGLSTFQIKL